LLFPSVTNGRGQVALGHAGAFAQLLEKITKMPIAQTRAVRKIDTRFLSGYNQPDEFVGSG